MTDPMLVTLTVSQLRELVAEAVAAALDTRGPEPERGEVLTREQAAQLLGVSLPTLRRLVVEGHVPERRLGDAPRYVRSELLAALQASVPHPRPENVSTGRTGAAIGQSLVSMDDDSEPGHGRHIGEGSDDSEAPAGSADAQGSDSAENKGVQRTSVRSALSAPRKSAKSLNGGRQ